MMATYFHGGSEIQADNLQTLYLVNPNYTAYSDTQTPPHNMLLLNPAAAESSGHHALAPGPLTEPPPQLPSQHLVGIPLAPPADHPSRPSFHENVPAGFAALHGAPVPRVQYSLWSSTAAGGGPQHQIPTAVAVGGRGEGTALSAHRHRQQGLSLSLNDSSPHKNAAGSMVVVSPGHGSNASSSVAAKGVSGGGGVGVGVGFGAQSVVLGSKYLRAAQELLDEAVSVQRAMNRTDSGAAEKAAKTAAVGSGEEHSGGESSGGKVGAAAEVTTALRQELQMKKAKLLHMLDEVERRYRLYNNQMQAVALSFEQVAGPGSARSYTALALQRISRQFRSLRDAIATQIRAAGKSLREDDGGASGGKGEGPVSRLRLVNQQLRQQLGMAQHSAWRPQRGLPERAVSVLRAWLFEHFLHPYPKDTDKHMLAKQTGLKRSQVSNWFINARVRLWKPMVEEMYLEEIKSQGQNASDDHTNTTNKNNQNDNEHRKNSTLSSKSPPSTLHAHQQLDTPSRANQNHHAPSPAGPPLHAGATVQGFSFIGSTYTDPPTTQRSPRRQRSSDVQNSSSSILSMEMEAKPAHGWLGSCMVGEIGSRFDPDQQPGQLTLGLPHGENLSLSGTQQHHQHNYMVPGQATQLWPRLEVGIGAGEFYGIRTSQPEHAGPVGCDGVDIQSRRRFAAQLFPDFVT